MDQQDEDRQDGRQDEVMDDEDEEGRQEPLAGVDWSTERVRIVGAETAGVLTGESPGHTQAPGEPDAGDAAGRENQYLGFVHYSPPPAPPPLSLPPDGEELAVVPPEMPHWSEPATGQVPAVIDSRSDEEGDPAWAAFADSGPVWREHEHEWEDTGGFEPAMLADEETRVGALSESVSEESRPWEFDDLTPPGGEEVVAASVEEEVRDAEPFADTGEMEVGHKAAGGFWAERSGAFLSERGDDFGAHGGRFGEDHRLFEKPSHGRRGDEMEQPDPVGARGAAVAGSSWWDDEPASTPAASASTVPTMADPGSPGTPGAPGASVTRAVVTEHVEPNGLDAP
ncbi:MAG TPA: hypothetical protein VEJ44_02615, partial [Acidimicrobiales bacterium]|nr:hypothetical protein [Acidimicrobiales bacterium]